MNAPTSLRAALPDAFCAESFLRDNWQKQPLLIRNPWEAWRNPLDPDALAGLACDEEVESRLIRRTARGWKVEQGPLAESRFARLGDKDWTLLVQAVDHHVPDVAALIDPFRFIPDWRIDDVMVSYAADGGGVGPHFDQYDVFLIQGLGRRRWQIGACCGPETPLLPHDDLRLLAEFQTTEEWVLEPGDILYVPPGFAHNGTAVGGDCMTYSVGFRAPSKADLVAHWTNDLLERLGEDDRYADPDLTLQQNPGEISADALARLHAMVLDTLADRAAFARWFGRYNSQPKYEDADWRPDKPITAAQLRKSLAAGQSLRRNPASRFAFIREADAVALYVDGECFDCDGDMARLAESLCAGKCVDTPGTDEGLALLIALFNQGSLIFEE